MSNHDAKTKADGAESLSTDGLGAAVIVSGKTVAWFADFTEEARNWCTYNHFGQWLTWRAKPPELVPLTEAEYDAAMKAGAELAAKLNIEPETPNVEHNRRTAASSPGVRVDGPVGPRCEEKT